MVFDLSNLVAPGDLVRLPTSYIAGGLTALLGTKIEASYARVMHNGHLKAYGPSPALRWGAMGLMGAETMNNAVAGLGEHGVEQEKSFLRAGVTLTGLAIGIAASLPKLGNLGVPVSVGLVALGGVEPLVTNAFANAILGPSPQR